jgi:glutamate racemase
MIGIFDSGVGGLSVLNEIHKLLPTVPLLYFADSKNIPYGNKSQDFLRERSLEISNFLRNQGAKVIVIACNTATAAAAESIREKLPLPVVAVEPPIKPAVVLCRSGAMAAIATEVTLNSARFNALLYKFAKDIKVIKRVSNDLVPIVENHQWKDPSARSLLGRMIDEFLAEGVDTVVLGSTHFSFLKDSILELSKGRIAPVGSAEATAQQVLRVSSGIFDNEQELARVKVLVSGNVDSFRENFSVFSEIEAEIEETGI